MEKATRLQVIKPIKSPYGIFANVGDVIVCDLTGIARNAANESMFIVDSEIRKCTRRFTFVDKAREALKLYLRNAW